MAEPFLAEMPIVSFGYGGNGKSNFALPGIYAAAANLTQMNPQALSIAGGPHG